MSAWLEEHVDDVYAVAATVSNSLRRRYWQWVEVEDIRQELMLWAVKHDEKVQEYLDREDPAERRRGLKALSVSMRRHGERVCRRAKAQASGYEPEDEFFYNYGLIRDLVRVVCTGGQLDVGVTSDRVRAPRDPAEGGNLQAMLADVKRAMNKLTVDEYSLVVDAWGEDVDTRVLGFQRGVARQSIEERLKRIANRMVQELGGRAP